MEIDIDTIFLFYLEKMLEPTYYEIEYRLVYIETL